MTTTHLFWPNQPRRAASSIPNSLRNPAFQTRDEAPPGGGGSAPQVRWEASTQKRSRNFIPNKSTLQFA